MTLFPFLFYSVKHTTKPQTIIPSKIKSNITLIDMNQSNIREGNANPLYQKVSRIFCAGYMNTFILFNKIIQV